MNEDARFSKWCNSRSCIEFEFSLRLGLHGHFLLRQCFCFVREFDVFRINHSNVRSGGNVMNARFSTWCNLRFFIGEFHTTF